LALVVTFLVLAPWCGALLALTCPADCCCGHNALADMCHEGTCLRSSPATAAGSAAVAPQLSAGPVTVPVATNPVPVIAVSSAAPAGLPAPAASPPRLFLQNASLLI